jgi:hypothetical protein
MTEHDETDYTKIEPWQLICEFFSPSTGHCHGILSDADYYNIGAAVPGYEATGDWSFIRDASDEEKAQLYAALVRTIERRGYGDPVAQALSPTAKHNKANARAQAAERVRQDLRSGRIKIREG